MGGAVNQKRSRERHMSVYRNGPDWFSGVMPLKTRLT